MIIKYFQVWLQGTVVDTIEGQLPNNPSVLRFSDGTGDAQVHNYLALPGGDSKITKGLLDIYAR